MMMWWLDLLDNINNILPILFVCFWPIIASNHSFNHPPTSLTRTTIPILPKTESPEIRVLIESPLLSRSAAGSLQNYILGSGRGTGPELGWTDRRVPTTAPVLQSPYSQSHINKLWFFIACPSSIINCVLYCVAISLARSFRGCVGGSFTRPRPTSALLGHGNRAAAS